MSALIRLAATVVVASVVTCQQVVAQTPDGGAVFVRECSSCHTGAADTRAPAPDVLRRRSPEAILSALTSGGMRPQGGRLTGTERRAVAEYFTGRVLGGNVTGAVFGRCSTVPPLVVAPDAPSWSGWSPSSTNTRYQTREQAGLTEQTVPELTLKWAFGFPDATSAWSQPTVAGGRLFVGSQNGAVYALDAKSGCIVWTFAAKSGVRNAPIFAPRAVGSGYAVYFGETGTIVWQTYTIPEAKPVGKTAAGTTLLAPAGVGVWSSPTVDHKRDVIYVATGNTYAGAAAEPTSDSLIALDPKTGVIQWTKQFTTGDVFGCRAGTANCTEKSGPDYDFGTPAMLVTRKDGKDIILMGQKSGMAADDEQLFIPVSDIRTPKPGGLLYLNAGYGDHLGRPGNVLLAFGLQ